MSNFQAIAAHLPYLRRFARALTGNQRSGDAYVAAALEVITTEPRYTDPAELLAGSEDLRVRLYSIFLGVWNSLEFNTWPQKNRSSVIEGEAKVARNLEAISPLARQAFLLCSVEGFTPREATQILDCDMITLAQLLDQAGQEMANQVATSVLIIEDEPLIAMDLADIVESQGHRVIGRPRTHTEAITLARRMRPGLVLADIQLADGSSGLEAVNDIVRSMDPAVIFVTAFPERLLTGERPEPTFLITKPFATDTVKAIVSQALFFDLRAGRELRSVANL